MIKNITKRDLKFFLLGIATIFILDLIFNWDENMNAFSDGYNAAAKPSHIQLQE